MKFDPEQRRSHIWSTQAAAALGLSARQTPAQLWAEKRGLSEHAELDPDNTPARLGLACQDGVARLHVEDTGNVLLPLLDVEIVREVSGVRMGMHGDFWNKTLSRLHEVKFFGMARRQHFGDAGTDMVPYDVLVQALHQMTVWNAAPTGYGEAQACEIDVVFGNVERALFVIPYDLEAVERLLQREAEFQALVDTNTPPPPQSVEDARLIWSKSDGSVAVADQTTLKAHAALMALRGQLKQLEAQKEEMELFVQRAMESAATLKAPDGVVLATWRSVETERLDVKRLRAELPQVAAPYLNQTTTRRFLPKG